MLEALDMPGTSREAFRQVGIFDGAELTVTYAVDADEHDARIAAGVGAVTNEFLLAALLTLSEDHLTSVEARFERALQAPEAAAAATVITDPEGGVWAQKRIRSAVDIVGIEISSTSLRRGCSAAHRWAGYGPRTVYSPRTATTIDLTEASHYGIGFMVADGEYLLTPATFVAERWSSARWRFAEMVYAQHRELLR